MQNPLARRLRRAMMELLQRRELPAPVARGRQDSAAPRFADTVALEPEVPLPQVSEGNSDADWALWESAVNEMEARRHAPAVPSGAPGEPSAGGSAPPRSAG